MDASVRRYCLTLDLKSEPDLIEKYKWYHQPENIWPEIIENIQKAGVLDMEIYLFGSRMCMIMEVDESFSFEKMEEINDNPKNQAWEQLMWTFQQPIEGAAPGEKWVLMERIFELPK